MEKKQGENKVYRYKLNYIDFLKLKVMKPYELERYLFLQNNPLEIEVYLEEIIMSVNHEEFDLGISNTVLRYYEETMNLVSSLVTKDTKEGREYFRVQVNKNRKFISELIKSYVEIMKSCRDIQMELIEGVSPQHYPITLVCSSYIINQLSTLWTNQYTGERLDIESVGVEDNKREVQVRGLCLEMRTLTPERNLNSMIPKLSSKWGRDKLKEVIKDSRRGNESQRDQLVDSIQVVDMYSSIINSFDPKLLNEWVKGKEVQLQLPYFDHLDRGVKSDWSYKMITMPRSSRDN